MAKWEEKAKQLRWGMNLWPPFWASGIRVQYVATDWSSAKVRLRMYWFNRNYVKVHYGGSLFSMTDPFYMLLLLKKMGKGYIVWDKKAEIKYIKAVQEDVFAEFNVDDEQVALYKQRLETEQSVEPVFEVDITNEEGEVVAKVWKTLYIAKKRPK